MKTMKWRLGMLATFVAMVALSAACGSTSSSGGDDENNGSAGTNCASICDKFLECDVIGAGDRSNCLRTCDDDSVTGEELICIEGASCGAELEACFGGSANNPANNNPANNNPANNNPVNNNPVNNNPGNNNPGNNNPVNNNPVNNNPVNNNPGECSENLVFTGQLHVGENDPANSPNGGIPTTFPWEASYDANLGEVLAAVPTDGERAEVSIPVIEATVVATHFNSTSEGGPQLAQQNFWIADGRSWIQVYFTQEQADRHPPFSIKVGQRINLTVTEVVSFFGTPEITNAINWELVDEGNEVYIDDRTGRSITAADINKLIRVTGTLTTAGESCGGSSLCYSMDFGGALPVTYRSSSQFVSQGSCVTFVGPVSARDSVPQLDTKNFDWTWNNDPQN